MDLSDALQRLRTGRVTPELLEAWLRETWLDRPRFRAGLYAAAAARAEAPIKSRPSLGLDVYADCVTSHLGAHRPALYTLRDDQVVSTSYEQLHERCSALASAWRQAGVEAGASLLVLLPVGIDYAAALLTGLRLGLTVTPLTPLGATYVRNRVAVLAPDYVVTGERWAHLLGPDAPPALALHAQRGDTTDASSHRYGGDDIALRLFSPFGENNHEQPHELSALELHEGALRDSMLVFALQPGDRVAAPSFDPLQWQPHALLCTWLSGSAWLECSVKDLATQPQLLDQVGVTVLGVAGRLRDMLLGLDGLGTFGRNLRAWFRSLNDVFDYPRWNTFTTALATREISHFAVLCNAASGGAHLFSPRTVSAQANSIWPAPGREFTVAQVGASLLPALDETGVYAPIRAEEPDPSLMRVVIAKLDAGWTLGGSIDVGPHGRTLPVAEIAACVERFPGVGAASVVVTPARWPNAAHVILLVFAPEEQAPPTLSASALTRHLRHELGDAHVPDRVEIFALHPRRKAQSLQAGWCASQYLSGMLGRKSRTPLFMTLSRLGWIFEVDSDSESEQRRT